MKIIDLVKREGTFLSFALFMICNVMYIIECYYNDIYESGVNPTAIEFEVIKSIK